MVALHVVRAGAGPALVLVHGSATDHATWTIQIASRLTESTRLIAYDRRGAGRSPLPDGVAWQTVEQHAADLATLIAAEAPDGAIAIGSSFGAAVVLETARSHPAGLRGVVLLEPPVPASDAVDGIPPGFLDTLDQLAESQGPGAAAERFLRTVLGDQAWQRLPPAFQNRSKGQWPQIRGDCRALAAYRVRYHQLDRVGVETLLLGGDRSAPYFRPTLEALAARLPSARLGWLAGASHMMHVDAPGAFHDHVVGFAREVGHLS